MQVVKMILVVLEFIICLALSIIVLFQAREDAGLSSTITGSTTNNFFEKNKSRTKEGRLKKWTIILGIIFVVNSIALSIIYIA